MLRLVTIFSLNALDSKTCLQPLSGWFFTEHMCLKYLEVCFCGGRSSSGLCFLLVIGLLMLFSSLSFGHVRLVFLLVLFYRVTDSFLSFLSLLRTAASATLGSKSKQLNHPGPIQCV